jgi:KDO2-lipid IV(A) lauroyltransferase
MALGTQTMEESTRCGSSEVSERFNIIRRMIRQAFEAPLVHLGALFISRLPRRVIVWLAHRLGMIAYWVSPSLRRVGKANLDLVFGNTKTREEKNRILRKSFESFSLVLLDLFWFSRDPKERMLKYVHYNENAHWFFCHKAQICLTGHMGNWETVGRAVSSQGFPLASVALPLKNPAVNIMLNKARESTGQIIIPRQGAVKALLQILRKGGKTAMLLDHNTLPSEGGTFVDFFGVPATISASAEAMASRTQAEIVLGFCIPREDGTYVTNFTKQLTPLAKGKETGESLTQQITKAYEEAILRFPEYWMWTYKRWKYIRPGDDPARYPFYAKPLRDDQH